MRAHADARGLAPRMTAPSLGSAPPPGTRRSRALGRVALRRWHVGRLAFAVVALAAILLTSSTVLRVDERPCGAGPCARSSSSARSTA